MKCVKSLEIIQTSKQRSYFKWFVNTIEDKLNQIIELFQILQKNQMLKKIKTSNQMPRHPSLKALVDQNKNKQKNNVLKQLFIPQKREIFELSYLIKSPHYNQDKPYTELVKIIEKYNDQTIQISNSNSLTKQINNFNKIKLACIRVIYRQLLSIAAMGESQIKKSGLAGKIKNWYNKLGQHHSFLEGINFKKRKQSIIETQIEENVRSTYASNVFDEIDDYLRKRISFTSTSKKDVAFSTNKQQKNKKSIDNINLPFVDLLLYKREDARLREIRQKQYQSQYFNIMLKNKNQTREKTILKLKNLQNTKRNINMDESESKRNSTFATQQNFYPVIKRQSFIERNCLKTRLEWFKSKQNNNRLNLSNINGINLIHYKIE